MLHAKSSIGAAVLSLGLFAFSVTAVAQNTFPGSGNAGIGTTSPSQPLDIMTSAPSIHLMSPGVSEGGIGFKANDGSLYITNEYGNGNALGWSAKSIVITQWGNVGINTTNLAYTLSVNGTVQAKEVIVQTGWSDYVFDANYRLMPLSEVEKAIQRDSHLPGIPSAQEIAEKGVPVGHIESKLLAKIEELTLYQIALEKRLQALETRNAVLEAPAK